MTYKIVRTKTGEVVAKNIPTAGAAAELLSAILHHCFGGVHIEVEGV